LQFGQPATKLLGLFSTFFWFLSLKHAKPGFFRISSKGTMWSGDNCLKVSDELGIENGAPLPQNGHLSGFLAALFILFVRALDGVASLSCCRFLESI